MSRVFFGYGYGRKDGALVVIPEEAAVVREIISRILADESLLSIARDLRERNVPTKRGGKWTATSVGKVARNPVSIGLFRWKGELLNGDHEPIMAAGFGAKRIFPPGENNWLRVLTYISRRDIIVS